MLPISTRRHRYLALFDALLTVAGRSPGTSRCHEMASRAKGAGLSHCQGRTGRDPDAPVGRFSES